ncbi:MAG TPA: YbaN family protein [Burkholderiaceae bacterium]|jgi:uncharacterized membrane protein YbaN (DUF454 family)|nr:YbaN family protein [Burkholderiaceae bacterium]
MPAPAEPDHATLAPAYPRRLLARSRGARIAWMVLGWLALLAGAIGVFLPVLPTTPFVLLAAACFARGSPRFYFWLSSHRVFGPLLRDWQTHRSIPRRAKQLAIGMMWTSMAISGWLFRERIGIVLTLLATALILTVMLARIPTRR